MIPAVIYARYSSDLQREESIEGQIREINVFAKKEGYVILHEYIDRAKSARTDKRPEFQQMIRDSSSKQFQAVLVWKVDRFARNRKDALNYKFILKSNGVKVVSATELNVDGPEGILLEGLHDSLAEFYSAELSQKIKRGITENTLKGKYNGGITPLGYYVGDDHYYHIDEETAPIVKEIFRLNTREGYSLLDLVKFFKDKGFVRPNTGRPFTHAAMQRLLRNKRYLGEYRHGSNYSKGKIPAIIDEETFELAMTRLKKNARKPKKRIPHDDYLLTTKLICGKCGGYMVSEATLKKSGKWYRWYKCSNRKRFHKCDMPAINKDALESSILNITCTMLKSDSIRKKIVESIMTSLNVRNPLMAVLDEQLKDVEKKIKNIITAIENGMNVEDMRQRLHELDAQKNSIKETLAKEELKKPMFNEKQVDFYLSHFGYMDMNDDLNRRALVDSLINQVRILPDMKAYIVYNWGEKKRFVNLNLLELDSKKAHGAVVCDGSKSHSLPAPF